MTQGPGSSRFRKRIARALLAFDAWIDSSLFDSNQRLRQAYQGFAARMDRWHVSGWRRWLIELLCEALTLGLGGAIAALALAIPAFQETSDDWLKKQDLAITFLDRNGNVVGRRGILHDDSLQLEQYPDYLVHAVLATEDRRFYEHFGIDVFGTLRAITINARSSTVVQGGSSITQQLAKNLFLSNERTIERKIKEAFLALWLESHLSKRQILTLYLDRAYMGGGTFGVQAAAQFYFGKSARDVTLAEAAMLAGLFKAPTKYAPHINLPAARARASDVLNNLVEAGYLTEGQIYAARKNPATPVDRKQDITPDYYLDWAFEEVKRLADEKKLGTDRVLTVKTALDMNLQRRADTTVETVLREDGVAFRAKQGAAVILDPDGAVRAMVGGRDYGASQFNRATEALRQPGSSFKPFVYLTALMTGKFHPNTIVVDSPVCIGNWCPHNFGNTFAGAVPLATALARSLNTVAVKLSIAIGDGSPKLGRARIVETARKMGITSPLEDTVSLPIGADALTVLEMGSAYSTFATGGKHTPPYATLEVKNSRGDVIYRADRDGPRPQQVINPATIAEMDGMLINDVEAGTGRAAKLDGIRAGGKTGTTNAYRDAWFIGFTGNYVGAVWLGNDDYTSTNNMTGGTLPAKIWHEIMTYAHSGIELKPLPGQPVPVGPPPEAAVALVSSANGQVADPAAQRPTTLSRSSVEAITGIEDMIHNVERKRAALAPPVSLASGSVGDAGATNRVISIGGRVGVE
ncbi:MAG: PBP1A family penicillin-binding protein [Methylobacteriaceae bacterium]|nr:PBP1A family penicillin-binding protein [Methylobacteriaceae bacterium]